MKKNFWFTGSIILLVLSTLIFAGCRMSKEKLTKQVKAAIEEQLQVEYSGLDIVIKDLSLIKKSDKEYRGILKLELDGETENFTVNVTFDGDTFMWEIPDL